MSCRVGGCDARCLFSLFGVARSCWRVSEGGRAWGVLALFHRFLLLLSSAFTGSLP